MLPYIDIRRREYATYATSRLRQQININVTVKLVSLFIFSYPLSGVLKRIPDSQPWQKNVFIISVSMFYLIGLFDLWSGLYTLGFSAAAAYIIATTMHDAYMPWVAFAVLMGHMSVSHLYRQARDNSSIVDITGAQMVLVMKLTSFCWNVHDGRLKDEDLTDFQRERAIKKMPSLLNYAGYVLFFPALMAGPAFDYVEYTKYISTSMFDLPPGTDPSKGPPRRKQRRIPRSGTPATIKMVGGLAWIFIFIKLSTIYSLDFLESSSYAKYGFIRRVWNLHLFCFAVRTKYYGVWALAEGACILSGIGYAGFDTKTGRAKWDRVVNVKPWELELAQNTRAYIGAWNINTNNWLRNYIYLRVTPKGKKPGFRASIATFVTSAMWHGFYPGYYMTFVLGSFLQAVAKNGRRYIRPFFVSSGPEQKPYPSKIYYDIFTWIITQLSFTFAVTPFVLLRVQPSLAAWSRVYFYGIIGIAASTAFFASPAKAILLKQLRIRTGRPELVHSRSESRGAQDVMLGLPIDAEAELQEIVAEVRAEIEKRRKEGLQVPDVRTLVREKIGEAKAELERNGVTVEKIKKEL